MSDDPAELLIPMTHWRGHLGLSQNQAAKLLGYSKRMIQYFEGGNEEIPRSLRFAMAYLLEHPYMAATIEPPRFSRPGRPRISTKVQQ